MRSGALLVALVAAVGCHPTPRPPQLGITAAVMLADGAVHQGELLAVHRDSLVLAVGDTVRWFAMDQIVRATIDRRVLGVGPSVRGMMIGGLVTGLALTIACISAESEGCAGAILPMTVGAGLVIGFLGGLETQRFRYATFAPPTVDQLRPWARYPQGMPPGLGGGPPE